MVTKERGCGDKKRVVTREDVVTKKRLVTREDVGDKGEGTWVTKKRGCGDKGEGTL